MNNFDKDRLRRVAHDILATEQTQLRPGLLAQVYATPQGHIKIEAGPYHNHKGFPDGSTAPIFSQVYSVTLDHKLDVIEASHTSSPGVRTELETSAALHPSTIRKENTTAYSIDAPQNQETTATYAHVPLPDDRTLPLLVIEWEDKQQSKTRSESPAMALTRDKNTSRFDAHFGDQLDITKMTDYSFAQVIEDGPTKPFSVPGYRAISGELFERLVKAYRSTTASDDQKHSHEKYVREHGKNIPKGMNMETCSKMLASSGISIAKDHYIVPDTEKNIGLPEKSCTSPTSFICERENYQFVLDADMRVPIMSSKSAQATHLCTTLPENHGRPFVPEPLSNKAYFDAISAEREATADLAGLAKAIEGKESIVKHPYVPSLAELRSVAQGKVDPATLGIEPPKEDLLAAIAEIPQYLDRDTLLDVRPVLRTPPSLTDLVAAASGRTAFESLESEEEPYQNPTPSLYRLKEHHSTTPSQEEPSIFDEPEY